MSRSASSNQPRYVQKICTISTHDESFSREDVIYNSDRFPELELGLGKLAKIVAINQSSAVRDFQDPTRASSQDGSRRIRLDTSVKNSPGRRSRKTRSGSVTYTLDENGARVHGGRDVDPQRTYVFAVKQMSADIKAKYPQMQISVSDSVARAFGFRNRMQVMVSGADEELHSASHVEISFRDEYLARADMWRLATSELSRRTVYRGQKVLFMGTIKAIIKNVFVDGQTTHSAYFSTTTKPVFRSESARYVLFIQMSREMWNFDTEGSGEIMFNKVINGFLPELFKRWMRLDAKHLVTIILFTRMQYDKGVLPEDGQPNPKPFDHEAGSSGRETRDFYRVVVSEMASGDWINILYQLKKEFRTFLRDVSVIPGGSGTNSPADQRSDDAQELPEYIIAGSPSVALRGNILEAINLAALQFSKDYIDRDLVRTGISVIVITAGTGMFEVDYNMLKMTTDILLGTGIGIDLVCLQPMPLHSVPLFKYRNPRLVPENSSRTHLPSRMAGEFDPFIGENRSALDPNDESTPRQNYPNFGPNRGPRYGGLGSFASSPMATRTRLLNAMHEAPPGDWSYAMPHWLDISFWTGNSDETFELSMTTKRGGHRSKTGSKSKGFALRCRMYELQMMGVMENEMSNIALPYIHENPLYPWQLLDLSEDAQQEIKRFRSAEPSPERTRSDTTRGPAQDLASQNATTRAWMDKYDEHIFLPLPHRRRAEEDAARLRKRNELNARKASQSRSGPSDSLLSASLSSQPYSLGSSGRPPPSPAFLSTKSSKEFAFEKAAQNEDDRESRTHRKSNASLSKKDRTRPSLGSLRETFGEDQSPSNNKLDAPTIHAKASSSALGETQGKSQRAGAVRSATDSVSRPQTLTVPERGRPAQIEDAEGTRSTASSTNRRPAGWLSRHISFSSLGFGPSKAAASTEVTTGEAARTDLTPLKNKASAALTPLTHKASQQSGLSAPSINTDVAEAKRSSQFSQPIEIRSQSRLSSISGSPKPSLRNSSSETTKDKFGEKQISTSQRSSDYKDPGSLFLLAGSKGLLDQVGPKINLSTSGGGHEIPRTLSPTSALAPWMVLVNPCNPRKNNVSGPSQFRRWHHVFPRPLRASTMKWKSLCSPAAVPLTNDYFPTAEQLATEYNENPYRIIQNDDEETLSVPKSREVLIRELIAFRLSHGFQIIIGSSVADFAGKPEREIGNIFADNYMAHDGATVFMCIGSTIHQLVCVTGGEVEVKRFNRKPTTALASSHGTKAPLVYKPMVRTALDENYMCREVVLKSPREEYNWNFIDSYLAGYEREFSDTLRFWRTRFVLIPVDLPPNPRRQLPTLTEDSDEEIRLEGIRKLTQLWQRYRYIPPEERQDQAAAQRRKDPNPLAIEYQTRDPSAVVAAGPDSSLLTEETIEELPAEETPDSASHLRSNYELVRLAQELQGEKGIQMMDRRWHWRLHYSCFVGFDLTTWLLQNFKDIETREEAVEFGNELMKKGLFQHVQKKHQFRDGNFFYQIASDYRTPRPDSKTSWFGTRKPDKSVPSTPIPETPRASSMSSSKASRSRPDTGRSSESGEKTPTKPGSPTKKASLSNVMRYDVDPRKRSYRPEIINLHYDRLHNPDNCYHIRIDWMNVTAKLIEDAVNTWATSVEKFGLKLVELPIAEATKIAEQHPFRRPYMIRLAAKPPGTQPAQYFDSTSFGPQRHVDHFTYHKAILRRLNFVLDMEAVSSFPNDVDVTYSWGRPDYRYTQFIHKTGIVLAQITEDGDFLLLANRLCNSRGAYGIGLSRDAPKFEKPETHERRPPPPIFGLSNSVTNVRSPFASPMVRPVPDTALNLSLHYDRVLRTAEQIKDEMELLCHDERALRAFYTECSKPRASPSPRTTPILDSSIPTLGLPPGVTARECSPAPMLGAALIPHPQFHSHSAATSLRARSAEGSDPG
ncbi:hypothetical protein K490DRAFT_51305 [Saccharata proteae CBS 121410]|uniref:Vacuolar membrane-associated protein IML1 n=1 Tax=Saccharata proteae CBS 121410 TaxID=1314787 RepID=A0A9P4HPH1_9PEZI|nr:hypothetical protein K490DRAFT_51305 [Saccharata proteae CBS 121410]